jgi:thioesterase domain-containing protein
MAEGYVEEIQAFQTSGPYYLAGYCFGGLVVYEMARRLYRAGHAVGLVALFDADAPSLQAVAPPRPRRFVRMGRRLAVEYANLAALSGRDRVAYARDTLGHVAERLAVLMGRSAGEQDPFVRRVARAQSKAARAYRGAPYAGRVVLYKAKHPLTRHFVDPWFGWKPLVGEGIEVRLIASNGGSIIQDPEGATLVAEDLGRHLPMS